MFLLDAKNYVLNFKNGVGMPGSSNIINAFLLPAELGTQNIEYIGKRSMNFDPIGIGEILCFYIDFDSLVDSYSYNDENYSDRILDYIFTKQPSF